MMGTPLRRKAPAYEMAEAELHKERLQALAEKRKRQDEIEDKRRQLDELVLQLQHFKSKAMRERWLLQGTGVPQEEDDSSRKRVEEDELHIKKLEDIIHRLESEICLLENEESQFSAKEQVLREKLRETEKSIEDLQKILQSQDGDAVNYNCSQIPDFPELNSQTPVSASGDIQHPRKSALYAMEINVEKDQKTGATKILSASSVSPQEAHQRGIKVYDDGRKVIYEVRSGGAATMENGMHPWSSSEVDELMQQVGQSQQRSDGTRVTVTPSEPHFIQPQLSIKEVEQEKKQISRKVQQGYDSEVMETPQATADKPVTMIFMGYHSVENEEETKKLLGFDGTIKAEIVLIDEDDEKSLREKTVTDISTIDGNAADLVSGRPLSDTTELSSEGKDESSTKELPSTGGEKARSVLLTTENGLYPTATSRYSDALKSPVLSEDDSELKTVRSPKTVSFFDSVSVISAESSMEFDAQGETQLSYVNQNRVRLDSEVAQEILYLDEVLEANCCESGADMNSNGTRTPEIQAIRVEGSGSSVHTFDTSTLQNHEIILEGKNQTTCMDDNFNTKPNGYAAMMENNCARSHESPRTPGKKEARFELRPFHEEKKPSKLFDTPTVKEVRVKKVRPSEEIEELEKERLELIRGQAVKKNPGIAAKWWNPPQEKTLEEELEPDQLESLRRYEERKQRRPETNLVTEAAPKQTTTFIEPEIGNREDIVMEEIDFSAARKQFLQIDHAKQPTTSKRNVAPQLYSAKPFFKTPDVTHIERLSGSVMVASPEGITSYGESQVTTVKAETINCLSGESVIPPKDKLAHYELQEDDFTCARAVMTFVKDEDLDLCQDSFNSSYHAEEIDSGLDDLSLRSQDTTVLETLSNDFSMDNISDSGASNETMSAYLENSLGEYSFPSTPIVTTPINGKHESAIKYPDEHIGTYQEDGLTEEELEYHASILVQNAIQQAITQQNDKWEPLEATQQSSRIPATVESVPFQPQQLEEKSTVPPPTKVPSSLEGKTITPQITVVQAAPVIPVNTYKPPSPSPPPNEKPEFSYFSKYSEAAELRSTAAVTRAQEVEVTSGPFKLRSRKQRTLSMIEEEIRAAQEREEELKRQRQVQALHHPCTQKKKSSNHPSKLVLTGRTVPGKIEKIRTVPPASPCSSDGALPSPLSDLGSDDSGGQRPKNYMQTLMEDYETHKVKRREKAEDNSVLEASVSLAEKVNMALRWEAGVYANQDEAEEE